MTPELPASIRVPVAERRKFVATCLGLWLGGGILWWACAASRHWEDVKEWVFGGSLMMLVLVVQALLERRLRRKWLPHHGQTLWCFRLVFLAPVLATILILVSKPVGRIIPGYFSAFGRGTVSSRRLVDDRPIVMSFKEEWRSIPGSKIGSPALYATHELRFHPYSQPELPGWIIRAGERRLRKEDGNATQPMTGEGLMRVLEDLDGRDFPTNERAAAVSQLNDLAKDWILGIRFQEFNYLSSDRLNIGASWSSDHPPDWVPHAIGVFVLSFVVVVISLAAKSTMGGNLPETR